ncbi:MAG: TetR/AcrR family transcriptional regulator [Alphaproteobacteria bacterium]|nr:TetR/AcrR family transcriptional regulator [Alphaproteobacteria bacterium]
MSGLREKKRAETLAALKAAAWDLFREHGFEGTTVRALAKRAGVATGTVFNYAEDKHDLLLQIFEDRIRPTQARAFETLPEAPLVDQLCHVFGHFYALYTEEPELGRVVVQQALFLSGAALRRREALDGAFFAQLVGLLAQAQARGEVAEDLELLLAVHGLFSDYFMVLVGFLSGMFPDRQVTDAALRQALELRMSGLAPRPETEAQGKA